MSTNAPPEPAPIRTDVSPAVRPEVLDALTPNFVLNVTEAGVVLDPAYSNAKAALQSLHASFTALVDAENGVKAAREPKAEARLRDAARARLQSAAKTTESALATIDARAREVESSIDESLGIPSARTSVTDAQRASDVRFSLRLTRESERFHMVRHAIDAGDVEAVAAVLSASPVASGISREHYKQLRQLAELKMAGKLIQSRDALAKLRTSVQRAGDITHERFAPLVGEGDSAIAWREASLRALEGGQQ